MAHRNRYNYLNQFQTDYSRTLVVRRKWNAGIVAEAIEPFAALYIFVYN